MFSNRRPYYGLKASIADFFREPVRYLKTSNTKESQLEKPYLIDEYQKMHLKIPEGKFASYKRRKLRTPGTFGRISDGARGVSYWDMSHECGHITAFGRRGGGLGHIGSGFGGFVGYGFGLGCKDETDIEFSAPSWTRDEDWIWEFSVRSSEIDTGSVLLTRIDSNTVTLAIVGDADGKLDVCGEGTNIRTRAKVFCCHWVEVNCSLCDCAEISIGYTTQQMAVDEVQTLTVNNPVSGCTYSWSIASGGGSLSSSIGTSVNYTAPSTNVDCVNNPTITLSVGGSTCDTLALAVAAIPYYTAAKQSYCVGTIRYCKSYSCDSSIIGDVAYCNAPTAELCLTDTCYSATCPLDELLDMRTEWLKSQGCCPAILL